jgi:Zn-dependent peptidase ImmA (M78 family)
MLLLSFRYRADDQFWFTVFHEIGHLLLHGAATFVEDEDTPADHAEREANDFAASCIVPSEFAKAFEELLPNRDAIIRFGVKVGVAPGLVLGQMQHQDRVHPTRLNSLKRTWTWSEIEPALV